MTDSFAKPQPQVFNSVIASERSLILPIVSVAVLFALIQGGLGILDYVWSPMIRLSQVALVGSAITLAFLGLANASFLPKFHRRVVTGLVALNALYLVASVLFGGVRPIFHVGSIVLALALVPVISDSRIWMAVVRGLFWGGMTLILLNMVPLLHWAGWVDLHPSSIPRLVDTGVDLSHLDPLSFGVFGRTENHVQIGHISARLQGWALEPIHWGYFVALTLACGLILRGLRPRTQSARTYDVCFGVIAIHLFFVASSSVYLTIAAWLGALGVLVLVRRLHWLRAKEGTVLFLIVVLGTGFLIPFALLMVPDIAYLLYTEQVLAEGSNWSAKVGFLFMGPQLFTRFLPLQNPESMTSHNLILELYLHYGYFLAVPLLVFLHWFLRNAVRGQPMSLAAAALLILLTHLLLVSAMFYPSGTLFLSLALVAGYYRQHSPRFDAG